MKRLSGVLLFLSLIAAVPQGLCATAPRELNMVEHWQIKLLFEEELWRPGGPRQERVVELVRQGIGSGNVYVFLEMNWYIEQWSRRHLLDPNSLAPLLPKVSELSVKGTYWENSPNLVLAGIRKVTALWNLSAKERHDFYERAIRSEKDTYEQLSGERVGAGWHSASLYALEEEMDDLVPLIEQVLQERKGKTIDARDTEEAIEQEYLPLARARLSRDWIGGYLEIIRQDTSDNITTSSHDRLIAERRTYEALLRLVVKNRQDALPELAEAWEGVCAKEIGPYVDGYHRWVEIATPLLRANRALGSKAINEKEVRKLIPQQPEEAERALRTGGVLKATKE